jgi:hypothetical protein
MVLLHHLQEQPSCNSGQEESGLNLARPIAPQPNHYLTGQIQHKVLLLVGISVGCPVGPSHPLAILTLFFYPFFPKKIAHRDPKLT